jgi:hypothetical protein
MRLVLVLLFAATLVSPLGGATLSPERQASEPVPGPASLRQHSPLVASNGLDYLVVWYDQRSAEPAGTIRYTVIRRSGAVDSAVGTVIPRDRSKDPAGATDYPSQEAPAALFRLSNGYLLLAFPGRALHIDDDGRITADLDASHLFRAYPWELAGFASDGRTITAVYLNSSQNLVEATIVDLDLRPIRTFSPPLSQSSPFDVGFGASDAGGYLFVSSRRVGATSELRGLRVDSQGFISGEPIVIPAPGILARPLIEGNEQAWIISAQDPPTGSVYVASIGRDGAVRLPPTRLATGFGDPPVATQAGFLVTVTMYGDLHLFRLAPDGMSIEENVEVLSAAPGAQYVATGAASADRALFVWHDRRRGGDDPDLLFAETALSGAALEGSAESRGRTLTISAQNQQRSAAATDGSQYFAVWVAEPKGGISEIRGGRLSLDGRPLDGEGIRLDTTAGLKLDLDVAFDGENFVVVWREADATCQSRLMASRVSRAGSKLDAQPRAIAPCSGHPNAAISAASNGSLTMVVFNVQTGLETAEVTVTRIARSGEVLDPIGRLLVRESIGATRGDIASDADGFLVVWRGRDAMRAARISPGGAAGTVTDLLGDAKEPSITWGNGRYLLAYSRGSLLAARLVDRDGRFVSDEGIVASGVYDPNQAVAFDGERFVVAWEHPGRHPRVGFPIDPPPLPVPDIRARHVAANGIPMQPGDGTTVSATFDEDQYPAVAGTGGSALLLYSRSAPEVTGVNRIFGRVLSAQYRRRPVKP